MELRPELRDERQLLRHATSGRRRPARSTWSPARPTASSRWTRSTGAAGHRRRTPSPRRTPTGVGTIINDPRPGLRRLLGQQPHGDQPPGRDDRARTSVTCSTPRASPGAGSRAASRRPAPSNGGSRASAAPRTPTSAATRVVDYSPHHEPFQYYASTANPHHLPPTLGRRDRPDRPGQPPVRPDRLRRGASRPSNLPAVSFLKAAAYQDGHAGYSDPLDEQHFLVEQINALQKSPEWKRHRGRHRLRRLRRLVRPRRRRRSSTAPTRRRPTTSGAVRQAPRRPAATRTAAAPARACRCWSSRPTRKANYVDHTPDRPDLDPQVHRGQLAAPAGSATPPSTPGRARSAPVRLQAAAHHPAVAEVERRGQEGEGGVAPACPTSSPASSWSTAGAGACWT